MIFYYVGWSAVFHKFAFLVHLIGVLKQNNNKEIHIYVDTSTCNLDFLKSYQNVSVYNIPIIDINIDNLKKSKIIDKNFINNFCSISSNKNIDLYISDVTILNTIREVMSSSFLSKKDFQNIINQFKDLLYKNSSINLFADGTETYNFFDSSFYNWFGASNFNYSFLTKNYPVAEKYFKNFKKKISKNIFNSDEINCFSKMFYFLITPIFSKEKSNKISYTKFFYPSIQPIFELNNNNSKNRLLDKQFSDNFFDPYNSLNSGIIRLINSFDYDQKVKLIEALKTKKDFLDKDNFIFDFMDNSLNIIYSGRLLIDLDEKELNIECKKILEIYKKWKDKNIYKNINFIFKCHPREKERLDLLISLKNIIAKIQKSNLESIDWLYLLNKDIPFETFISFNTFSDCLKRKRKFIIYGNFSTTFLMTYDFDKSKNIIEYILSKKEEANINKIFGKNSLVFPFSKRKII